MISTSDSLVIKTLILYLILTATEKQKHLGARFNRSGVDLSRSSLTLPKKLKKPTPDTISLIDSSSSMESLSTAGLLGSKQLSSSLLNINENTGMFDLLSLTCNLITCIVTRYHSNGTQSTTLEQEHFHLSCLHSPTFGYY